MTMQMLTPLILRKQGIEMAKKVRKVVKVTTIRTATVKVVNNGVESVENSPVETMERVTDKNAVKIATKTLGIGGNIVVLGVETREEVYAMDLNKFIMYAEKITNE